MHPTLEVADIFRQHGEAFRLAPGAALLPEQRRAMRAIEACRSGALGGHVEECDSGGHQVMAYNSCRNRQCPKCQALATAQWLAERQADLLPVDYFHVVLTVPAEIAPIALQHKRVCYDMLFRTAADPRLRIAADPNHLGAEIAVRAVLHTWGQHLMHHPHLHGVVAGGGRSPDGTRFVTCRPGFLLPVRVRSRLFRRLCLEALERAFVHGELVFHASLVQLRDPCRFAPLLEKARQMEWVVYAKAPFGGPSQVLNYLGRYAHRVAISNHRRLQLEDSKVTFQWKDYRHGNRQSTMTLEASEFIRRFLLHVLPKGFQRIRQYGFLSNRQRGEKLAHARRLLGMADQQAPPAERVADYQAPSERLTGASLTVCPVCRTGRLHRNSELPPTDGWHPGAELRPATSHLDTS